MPQRGVCGGCVCSGGGNGGSEHRDMPCRAMRGGSVCFTFYKNRHARCDLATRATRIIATRGPCQEDHSQRMNGGIGMRRRQEGVWRALPKSLPAQTPPASPQQQSRSDTEPPCKITILRNFRCFFRRMTCRDTVLQNFRRFFCRMTSRNTVLQNFRRFFCRMTFRDTILQNF